MTYIQLTFILLFWCLVPISTADVAARDKAVETNGIRVEFNSISISGIIYVYQCEQCNKSNYTFTKLPQVIRRGTTIAFDIFMNDFRNAKYPTLILDKETLTVLKIVY